MARGELEVVPSRLYLQPWYSPTSSTTLLATTGTVLERTRATRHMESVVNTPVVYKTKYVGDGGHQGGGANTHSVRAQVHDYERVPGNGLDARDNSACVFRSRRAVLDQYER